MEYFDEIENVKEYLEMSERSNGKYLIEILQRYLKKGSTLLELGMGPGRDLDILCQIYKVTGSDSSQVFLDIYQGCNGKVKLLKLDAVAIETDQKFDSVYSNKVLHHLSRTQLKDSFRRQKDILNDQGILFHTFWRGHKEELISGLRFVYYDEKELLGMVADDFKLLEISTYKEVQNDDSIYMIFEKK
jgi:cyclopropane fatty-acyl-phospholipid synthase-like methyltransferase